MKEVAVSEFKAKCLGLLDKVQKTRQPLRITRYGKVIAEVIPPSQAIQPNWIGSMRDSIEISGDIVAPANDLADWEALRD